MKLAAPRPSKTLLLIIAVAILGVLAGSGGTYLALRDQLDASPVSTSEEAQNLDKADLVGFEDKLPENTVSPTAIAADVASYRGKELKVRGRIVEKGPNEYILAGQEQDHPAAIKLDVSKLGDISQYVSGYTDESRAASSTTPRRLSAVTVTGTLTDSEDLTLTASKIE